MAFISQGYCFQSDDMASVCIGGELHRLTSRRQR